MFCVSIDNYDNLNCRHCAGKHSYSGCFLDHLLGIFFWARSSSRLGWWTIENPPLLNDEEKTVSGYNWILAGGSRFGKQLHWSLESTAGHKYAPWETAFIGCLRAIRQDSFTLPIIVITFASHMSLICGREYRPVDQRRPSAKSCSILLLENRWD